MSHPRRRLRAVTAAAAATALLLPLALAGGSASAAQGAVPDVRPNLPAGAPKLSDYSAPVSDAKVSVTPIDFEVSNLLEPGSSYILRGFLYEPKNKKGCKSSILQANHALTTGAWYWDIPFQQQKYSIARAVARSGIPFLSLNKLGYGQEGHPFRASDRPPGKTVTIQALADASHQVTQQLRKMGYEHVGLIGHSAGSEESEIHAGQYQDVDALILSGFTHMATPEFVKQVATEEVPRAMKEDYPFFFGDFANRDGFLFTKNADPALVKALHPLVNNTPSGEILSIGPQPSRLFATQVKVPVLTLIADDDAIFAKEGAETDKLGFVSTDDVTFKNYAGIGHGVEFHRNGPEITEDVVNWMKARPKAMPAC
ncbi:MAG: alpha/beta hydrolase [Sporichthyaceae bacterium]